MGLSVNDSSKKSKKVFSINLTPSCFSLPSRHSGSRQALFIPPTLTYASQIISSPFYTFGIDNPQSKRKRKERVERDAKRQINVHLPLVLERIPAPIHHPAPTRLHPRHPRAREVRARAQTLGPDCRFGDGFRIGLVEGDGLVVEMSADLAVGGWLGGGCRGGGCHSFFGERQRGGS